MGEREKQIWISICDARPANYFGQETWPLLRGLCMHTWLVELLAAELRANPRHMVNRVEHRRESAMVAMLSRALRLGKISGTHQSTDVHKGEGAPRRKLWLVPPEKNTDTSA